MLRWLPEGVGRWAALIGGTVYLRRTITPAWRGVMRRGDSAVLGGGQLFQDEHLDFPLKLWWLARRLREAGASLAVYSVGVSPR